MHRFALVTALALTGARAHADPVLVEATSTHPGIVRERWRDDEIPARVELVQIDLTSAEIGLFATTEQNRGKTTSQYAASIAAQVAINGAPFAVAGFRPYGLAVGDRVAWTNTSDDAATALLHFRRTADDDGERTRAEIAPPEQINAHSDLPAPDGVISGRPLLIRAGTVETTFDCDDAAALACERAPRSAVALSADRNTLYLITVDGWQSGSVGMTASELARFLRTAKNPDMAFALDSGSASTLVLDGAVVNSPSDGVERLVANHLGVKFGALPRGQLTGLICKNDVIACRTDTSLYLPGAEVTLDDGRVQVVGANASYNFNNITPRLACVTVRLTGYLTRTACDKVPPGQTQFESVPMFEGVDPPDAGPRDAGVDDPRDAGGGNDAGLTPPGSPGGCCDGGAGAGAGSIAQLVLCACVMLFVMRRR